MSSLSCVEPGAGHHFKSGLSLAGETGAEPILWSDLGRSIRQALGIYTASEVAAAFNYDEDTLKIWRYKKIGPAYSKCGKNVFYRRKDLIEWIEASLIQTGLGLSDSE